MSSVSSDDDLEEGETTWSDVLEGIPDRPFGAAVDAAVPGCSFDFVLPKEANEFDFLRNSSPSNSSFSSFTKRMNTPGSNQSRTGTTLQRLNY